jgi:ubiquinol-cytochrome c reductase cytochrome b subunit
MKERIAAVGEWIEHRTGVIGGLQHFLYEEIPASSGWHQVFGSVAMFLFMVQAFTGIMLSFNYAPTPGDSYDSLRYILTALTAGPLMRGLHHWGATLIVIIVGVHMIQVFLWGAYKKPREATWMVGVVLLLITLAFGLTGYLLPWDNRAYWGTTVTTRIAAMSPGLGPYLTQLLGASEGVGVVTFARFFAVHVLILPPVTILLVALHVFLVRRHGVAPNPDDAGKPKKMFFPMQVFKDTVAIFIAFAILFSLAIAAHVPLEQMADPTDDAYIPRPEWYFLFLFQFLKMFNGPLEVIGAVVLPGVAVAALFLVPFFDRGAMVKVTKRTFAIGVVLLAAIGWTGLTVAAVKSTPPQETAVDYSYNTDWLSLTPDKLAVAKVPDMPDFAPKGAAVYQANHCNACHMINGVGGKIGPSLNGLAKRQTRSWVIQHFIDPQKMSPGTSMPPYKFSSADMDNLTSYLLALPKE